LLLCGYGIECCSGRRGDGNGPRRVKIIATSVYSPQLLLSDRRAMLETIKNTVNAKNLRKATQNEEIRKIGRAGRRAAIHAGREFVKAFGREYEQERKKG
jgi:hypothetical protein